MSGYRVLFVCMGNICRSPTAEGVFRNLVEHRGLQNHFEIASAGTGGWHVGNPPDLRAQQAASRRGIDLSSIKARKVSVEDISYYDLIIAMDRDNHTVLSALAPDASKNKVRMLREFVDNGENLDVPDPYYGGVNGFDLVLDLIEEACDTLLSRLQAKLQ